MTTSVDLETTLAALTARCARLSQLDDDISSGIQSIEQLLHGHVNVRISMSMPNDLMLIFGKCGGKWCLLVQSIDGAQSTPVCSLPRDERVALFADDHIETLIQTAVGQLDERIADRERAIAAVLRLTAALTNTQQGVL